MPQTPLNPDGVYKPVGQYSHVAHVKAGSDLFYIAGQVGLPREGRLPATIDEQADQAYANLMAILKDLGLTAQNLAKINNYIVYGQKSEGVRAARLKHLGAHAPASTLVFVPSLVTADYLFEVEAVAVR